MTLRYLASKALTDVLHADGEALVMLDETLLRLGPLAAEVLHHCAEPRTIADLVSHCLRVLGPAPDGAAEAVVTDAVHQLVERQILTSEVAA